MASEDIAELDNHEPSTTSSGNSRNQPQRTNSNTNVIIPSQFSNYGSPVVAVNTRIQELSAVTTPAAGSHSHFTNYSPIDPHGPFAEDDEETENISPQPELAKAAQNLPGSLLPPAAVAELRGTPMHGGGGASSTPSLSTGAANVDGGHDGMEEEDEGMPKPPPLPAYANKPYLSMLSEDEGREGRLPAALSSPPRKSRPDGSTGSREGSRPSSSSGSAPGKAARIANRDSTFVGMEEVEWPSEALLHMGIGVPPMITKRKEVGSRSHPKADDK